MQLQIASDLHLEQGCTSNYYSIIKPAADILILAGDVAYATHAQIPPFMRKMSEAFEKVLLVPGNHERYSHDLSMSMTEMDMHLHGVLQEFSNVSLLNNKVEERKGVKFVGSTLWSHIPQQDRYEVSTCINDYRYILDGTGRAITPAYTSGLHRDAVAFLEKHCDTNSVVITHHCPQTTRTSHPRYAGSPTNCAFSTDVSLTQMPQLWVSGHTHFNHDFVKAGTRFISNQYRNENWCMPYSASKTVTIA
ncbi:Metallo-dependent phosphatase-like protein [Tribonema minus]|uniref:Metallo-dependent phosphatase-like protein n=1 Tax=Tribonema minus TaxID=303371 RepID=A0A835Z861_9STRA|nr:Metallo-dependent phosphatase-like protein [Tribonema minus]